MRPAERWYVYIARCSDGSLYTGIAKDVVARIAAHDAGKGARYTKGRGPLTVWGVRRCDSKGDALRLERAVKRLSQQNKEKLGGVRHFRTFAQSVHAEAGRAR
jgi:putative endonuclease